MSKIRLNLGCGDNVIEGWENYDLHPSCGDVKPLDLNYLPLPFPDNHADRIRVSQVLEHLECHPFEFIQECHRILKPGGTLFVGLPSFSHSLPHLRGYHPEGYMNVVIDSGYSDNESYHSRAMFRLEKMEREFSIGLFLRRLYEFVRAMASKKIEWTMRKEEIDG